MTQDSKIDSGVDSETVSSPLLSVVVVTVYNLTYLSQCLSSLIEQSGNIDMEIIAVCDERVDALLGMQSRFENVIFHHMEGLQTQEGMRAIGAGMASGNIIAFTVDHCTPEKHWCKNIIKEHSGPYAAVGGGFEKGTQPDTLINLAVHFYDYCNYGYFQSPVKRGPAKYLSDGNVAYKREALMSVARLWKESFHVSFVNAELLAKGEILWLSPDILVYQNRDITFERAMKVAFRRGRVFGSKRVSEIPKVKRLILLISSIFLPLLLVGRFIMNIIINRAHLSDIAKASPLIILLVFQWSSGELIGYLTGRALMKPGETYD